MRLDCRLLNTSSFRLAALCTGIFCLILAGLLVLNYLATNHYLEEELFARINEDLSTFAEEANAEGVGAVVREIEERVAHPVIPGSYYFASDALGIKIAGNLTGIQPLPGEQRLTPTTAGLPDRERAGQIWGVGQLFADGRFVFAGQDARRILLARHGLITSYLWSGATAGFLSLLAGMFISRGFLGRIDAINATSMAIMSGNLSERIPTRGTSDEVDKLSANLNRLFDSNSALLESLRQVTVNIAHDLRTPLARLRNRLESASDMTGVGKPVASELAAAISESDQLLATFAALLRIAHIESGTRKVNFATIDLSALAERVHAIYQAVAEDEGKELVAHIKPGIQCKGDGELLLQLCVNLVENAICHTPKGTRIEINVGAPAVLQVFDAGPGIPAEQRVKVLERFYRMDRSRSTPGTGLGLAMVSAIATLHGSHVEFHDNDPGLKASVSLQPV